MGDAGKKSLPKEIESGTAAVCSGIELHCFPDINIEKPNSRRLSGSDEALFHRVVPGSNDCICGPFQNASDIEDAGQKLSVEEIEQIGYQRGYCEGEQKGLADGEALGTKKGRRIVQPVIETLENLLEELAQLRRNTYQRIETEIVDLSMAVARKIVGQELATSPDIVSKVIRQALNHLETAGKICIKLNPEDLDRLTAENSRLCSDLSDTGAVTFEGEASIACGGCVIETDAGTIDARLETQFKAIDEAFQAAMSTDYHEG